MIPREELLRVRRLASRTNPRIKDWSALDDRGRRESLGLTVAEGARLVGEGLSAMCDEGGGRFRPTAFLVSDSGAQRPDAERLFAFAADLGVERFSLADDCFAKLSGLKNADGLALIMACDYGPAEIEPFSRPDARWLIAAGVQDPGNAGALARTALAAGCTGCLFLDGADPRSPKFLRGSMGAAFRFPCLAMGTDAFVSSWRRGGCKMVVASAFSESAVDYGDVDYSAPVAVVVGGERGIPEAVIPLADVIAHIPLNKGVESLNLAVAAGLILFEARRRWPAVGTAARVGG